MTTTEAVTPPTESPEKERAESLWPYLGLGVFLGFVFTRAEVVSWFRIQEMFRFHSFHMYGIIGSAVAVAAVGVWWIRRSRARSFTGRSMDISRVPFEGPGYQFWIGGTVFGLGWGLLGACPGPIYVLIGNGVGVVIAALASALIGAWTYGAVRGYLPHN